ncbi:MAG: glycosyltransferase family 2 protein [Albidovulum sp.]|nr:glycosyltransferase family 2 protein [Albidovulum sp.]
MIEKNASAVSVVVPTFREAGNLEALVSRLDLALSEAVPAWEILVVDDDSGDGIEEVAAKLAESLPVRLEIRSAPRRDLSLSVLRGLELAKYDRIVVMDADLSHPPEMIPEMLSRLGDQKSMVLGSRYLPGSSLDEKWGADRFLQSRLATILTKPLVKCADPMSGFFAVDRRWLPELSALRPIGFKIGLEIMVRCDLPVSEIPIHFQDRSVGRSKMNARQQINYLRHLWRLYLFRFGRPGRIVSFVMVGTGGLIVDLAIFWGFRWLGLDHRVARLISFWSAASWNWWFNRNLTFEARPKRRPGRQWAKFVGGSLLGFAVNYGSYIALTEMIEFFYRNQTLALFCGVALGTASNYLMASLFVFPKLERRRRNS